ncbi:hypothetical protein OSB04_009173 [Centaurea solstitialis]|uniref:Cytochrome P450 n=1 Tax=Centaurea solstitialis TaxID=347529 RepID=A0AA38TN66_9ASTR|nr:hypothetical protein OSB04_009173 [Centaurea solstitialis]
MEAWFIIITVVSLCIAAVIISRRRDSGKKLPPGPSFLSSNLLLLTTSRLSPGSLLTNLKSKYGPIITLSIGFHPSIFVSDHSLAHRFLIQKGAVFSDRPKAAIPQCNISSASYGPTWRILRRNLAWEVLHPSRVKSYSWARNWVLRILIGRLRDTEAADGGIQVVDHFQFAMFSLLVLMCFGEKFDEPQIDEIARVQRDMLLVVGSGRFTVLTAFPKLGRMLFRNRWRQFEKLLEDKERVLIPLIRSRIVRSDSDSQLGNDRIVAYVDTLVNLRLPEEETTAGNGRPLRFLPNWFLSGGGKLTEKEMVSMCSEFLNAGTDTTSTALQWIMANLVKHPDIQSKLYDEIVSVVGPPPPPSPPGEEPESTINEDDVQKMPYLKAVVLEGLRRHPPAHFVLPHRVSKEVEVEGHVIPEGANINFFVAEMGWDPKVWDDPMEFKPERFLEKDDAINGGFDVSGSKGIKMMPFGAGRRICPGSDLALLHLEYFVANLIWFFQWNAVDGYGVDLSEKSYVYLSPSIVSSTMETWFVVVVSLCMAALIRSIVFLRRKKLPPGPSFLSSNLPLFTTSRLSPGALLTNLKSKYGPLFTLSIGFRPSIFVSDHSLAHQFLIQKGELFSDRPPNFLQRNIGSAAYGPTWHLLRRNLASLVLHPSRVKSYLWARNWVLRILIGRLQAADGIQVVDHFRFAMFSLLVLMCFGEKLDERKINEIARVQRDMLLALGSGRFTVLTAFPKLGKILFRNRWRQFEKLLEDKERVLIPLIKSRIEASDSVNQLGND